MTTFAIAGACALLVSLSAQGGFSPARYRDGAVPPLPALAVGGGEVFLEVAVGSDGRVAATKQLRTTRPFTDLVVAAVRGWQFVPAEEETEAEPGRPAEPKPRKRVASKVLVAGVFRPPALFSNTTLGELPKDVASESDETPFPLATTIPVYPPKALERGVVLVEARIDRGGAVTEARVIRSARPFDDVARAAARRWRFRPARVGGRTVESLVYILFGFPTPVTGGPGGGGPSCPPCAEPGLALPPGCPPPPPCPPRPPQK